MSVTVRPDERAYRHVKLHGVLWFLYLPVVTNGGVPFLGTVKARQERCLITGKKDGRGATLRQLKKIKATGKGLPPGPAKRLCSLENILMRGQFPVHAFIDEARFPFTARFCTHVYTYNVAPPFVVAALASAARLFPAQDEWRSLLPASMCAEIGRDSRTAVCTLAFQRSVQSVAEAPHWAELDELARLSVFYAKISRKKLGASLSNERARNTVAALVPLLEQLHADPTGAKREMYIYAATIVLATSAMNQTAHASLVESLRSPSILALETTISAIARVLKFSARALDSADRASLGRSLYASFGQVSHK